MDTSRTGEYVPSDVVQTRVQSKVVTQSPEQINTVVAAQVTDYEIEKSTGLGAAEIILRVVCLIFLVALLIAASITLFAVNNLEDNAEELDQEYENAGSYRGAAGWVIFLAVSAIVFHGLMILIRMLYLSSMIVNYFSGYAFLNALLCIIFGVSLFSGGIANAVYASDNNGIYDDHCTASATVSSDIEVCERLETLYGSQAAATSFSFFSLAIFIVLFVITLISGIRKLRGIPSQDSRDNDSAPLYTPLQNSNW